MKDENTKNGLSVIVPFLNENDGIMMFCNSIDDYASNLSFPIEVVFVNDGSTDETTATLKEFVFKHVGKVKLINLSKNFGSHAAIRAGVMNAYYDNCTWLGCDLQEPMDLIKIGFEKLNDGYDAVYIDKKTIKIRKSERAFSKFYSYMMRKYAVKSYSSGGISVIVFNKKIKDLLNQNIESNSSIMLQIMDSGFKSMTISMNFNERVVGQSKWTLSKKIKVFIDSFVAFSFMPIRLVSLVGLFMFMLGFLVGVYTIVNKILNQTAPLGYSTLLCAMAMGFGITNISLGIIAEYLWRAYDAARKRPVFIVSEIEELKVL